MDRTACVDLPSFPLQLLLQRNPAWALQPAAVVESDRPQAKILWVNERARAFRILPGMRYAAGLSLARGLRAAVVPQQEIDRTVASLSSLLRNHTPDVEPAESDPGSFWLDATGLERLNGSLDRWADKIRTELRGLGYRGSVVVGYSRFGTYALARVKRGAIVLRTPAEERAAARRVPLDRLSLPPEARETLHKLGVSDVGQFLDLPSEGVARRFGPEVHRLHRLGRGVLRLPLKPERPQPAAVRRLQLDHPETAIPRLMVGIERMLPPLLKKLAERGHAAALLHLGLQFERLGQHVEKLRPAEPTLDAKQLVELIRLRLEAVRRMPDGVVEIALAVESVRANQEQLRLFAERPRRDLSAGNRALARLRAELGDDAVVRARLREGHLPEATFLWETVDELAPPKPREVDGDTMVRRIYGKPLPLASRPRHEPDGWMLRGLKQGPVIRVLGPYVVSGGWWRRSVHREYHFAETQKGELLWVYYDRPRRRWYVHGRVE